MKHIELEERLARIPIVIFQFQLRPDGSSFVPYANSGLETVYGVRPAEVAMDASAMFAVIHPDDSACVTETIRESARTLSPWRNEHRIIHPDRGVIWVEGNATPEIKPDGSVLLHGFITEITERKLVEESIKQQVVVKDSINRIFREAMNLQTEENHLGERCLAVAEEITGSEFGFIGEIGPNGYLRDIALSSPGRDACKLADSTGHRRPPGNLEVHGIYGRVLMDEKGFFTNDPASNPDSIGLPPGHPPLRAFLGVPLIRDGLTYGMIAVCNRKGGYSRNELESLEILAPLIVEAILRKKEEVALKEREKSLSRAEEIAHLGHWRYDLSTGRITCSDEMCRIFGLRREDETISLTFEEITKYCHPDDLEQCVRSFKPSGEEGRSYFEYRIIRPDGEERYVILNGETERNERDAVVALFGTLLDATRIMLMQRELREKTAEMERFTYMISHDLKSPLVTFKTFLGYLMQDLAQADAGRIEKDMLFMSNAADKMGHLLEELLEMSRIGRVVNMPVRVTFRELAEETLSMVAGSIAERGVEVRVSDEPITLYGDRSRLIEIWQNLVENAVKFMGDQPAPCIAIGAEQQGREKVFFVRDNGIGIDPRYNDKVFGLFEKLNPTSEGAGLGLALVKRIVEMYRGTIRLESEGVGQGSCFLFTLPEAVEADVEGAES